MTYLNGANECDVQHYVKNRSNDIGQYSMGYFLFADDIGIVTTVAFLQTLGKIPSLFID